MNQAEHHDMILIGAGFAGVYGVHRLRGEGWDVICIEAAADVGGVWYHNRYPGARCDVLSVDYSYSFDEQLQQDWDWSEKYSPQPEILKYIQHVADRFDLRRSMVFNTRVTGLARDDASGLWTLETNTGKTYTARYVVLTTGPLSMPADPPIPGLSDFKGELYFTARWPHEPVTYEDKRVGVIGTGSSGIQSIPVIAKTAGHITVFQRTAVYAVPARNVPMDPAVMADYKARYPEYRAELRAGSAANYMATSGKKAAECTPEERRKILDDMWEEGGLGFVSVFTDTLSDENANEIVAEYVRERIRQRVNDPVVAEKLVPKSHPIGTKRPCLDTGYYEVFNQPNATLVDLRETPIERITETGVQTSAGFHELDMLVLATGFDALTGAILAIDPVNGKGERLSQAWADGAKTYLGLAIAGFPNLFSIGATGSTSVFTNLVPLSEACIDWVADAIAWLKDNGLQSIEATPEAQAEWTQHVIATGDKTLFPRAESWYMGANIPGKARGLTAYLGGFKTYVGKCREVAEKGYEGFIAA